VAASSVTSAPERVSAQRLDAFAIGVLRALGMPSEDAKICTDALVWSDLRGDARSGVTGRLPEIVSRVQGGHTNIAPSWRTLVDAPGFALLDAEGGWGQVAGTRGMRLAIAKARASGAAITLVQNSETAAALGWYPTVAVREGLIGMAISNTSPLMPPWGGTTRVLGSQPFAIGSPGGRHGPVLFDSSVAAMSFNGIEQVEARGGKLEPGVGLDAQGRPTIEPSEVRAGGSLLPMGGHRGSGLAFMWEILTGVLSGGPTPPQVGGPGPKGCAIFLLAIDPGRAMSHTAFEERVESLVGRLHAATPAPGIDAVRAPGERGDQREVEYRRDGIPVSLDTVAKLRALGDEFGVAW
jgi:LDH2 family malate/lactate/ureidoglycolate dehydrogenase